MYTWGSAASGKLGLGEITDKFECFVPTPTRLHIPGGRRIRFVACGNAHTAAVSESGELLVWGCGDGGRLGLGAEHLTDQLKPVAVNDLIPALKGKRLIDP